MPAAIFQGANVKLLKANLDFFGNAKILTGDSDDPRDVAKDAPIGSLYIRTDGLHFKKLDAGSTTNWELVGSNVSGTGFNYIKNSDAEVDDQDVSSSANVTVSVTAVDKIRGTQSFQAVFSSSATVADYIEFAMDDLDLVDQAKDLIARLAYSGDAGVATGDFEVYIRNLDSASDILITNPELLFTGGHTKAEDFIGRFQADATDNTYALRIRPTFSFGTARTLKIDAVSVNADIDVPGYIGDEWSDYSATVAGFGTSPTVVGKQRRVGDSAEIGVSVKVTNITGAAAFKIDLPPGLVVDTSKVLSQGVSFGRIGYASYTNEGTGAVFIGSVFFDNLDTNTVIIHGDSGATQWNASAPQAISTSTLVNIIITVPIEGWKATNLISTAKNLFRNVDIRGEGNGGTSITANVTDIDFTETSDNTNSWNGSQFTAKETGNYQLNGMLNFTASASNRNVATYVNGSFRRLIAFQVGSGGAVGFNGVVFLNAGDVFSLRTNITSTLSNSISNHHISINSIKDTSVFGVSGETALLESGNGVLVNYPLAVNTWGDLTTITLPPGEWDIDAFCNFFSNGVTAVSRANLGIGTASGTDTSGLVIGDTYFEGTMATTNQVGIANFFTKRGVVVTSTQTFYLKSHVGSSITNVQIAYKISARRVK